MADREKFGLRGPVKQCSEETISPAAQDDHPEMKLSDVKEFDPGGRILSVTYINPDGSKSVITHTYDSQGRLLKTSGGAPGSDTTYTYDESGRLLSINGYSQAGASTRFEYDDHGRKTRIASSNVKPNPQRTDNNAATGLTLDGDDDLYYPVPQGGTVKTLFNESDQATETQVYNAYGQLQTRMVRRYDAKGRPSETEMLMENIESLFPAEARARFLAQAGVSAHELAEELKRQLSALRGGHRGMFGTSYTYDAQGRVAEKRVYAGGARETVTKITYNDHGDKLEERTTTSGDANLRQVAQENEVPAATFSEQSEVRYSYQYDSFGNWIERTITDRSNPNQAFTISTLCHRTISYY